MLKPFVPTEAQVLASVLQALRHDKRVAWCGRFNSGAQVVGEGKQRRFLRFHDVQGFPDIAGQLTDGRFLAIECKRPGWKSPADERERRQQDFLALVDRNGGVSGFARGIDDVFQILDGSAI